MSDVISLEAVSAGYDGHPVLRDLTLCVAAGDRVGLIGPNAAGKTTLLDVLVGLRPVAAGSVQVCGMDPGRGHEVRTIRRKVSLVFQNADDQLFSGTVFDDVAFGPLNLGLSDDEVRRRATDALSQVGLAHLGSRTGHHLSAGEKRRVALAAGLAMGPEVLLLDEPTGELDPRGRRGFLSLINRLPQTIVVATHDLEFVLESCRRVVVLDEGRVVGDGEPRVLLADATLMDSAGLEVPYSLRKA